MILTDREIEIALRMRQIILTPSPDLDATLSSTSIDLRLSSTIRVWKADVVKNVIVTPADPSYDYRGLFETFTETRDASSGFELHPGAFLLGWTSEVLELPATSRIAARVEGKSSLARLGIAIHTTAPTVHAGFTGAIQLEIKNHGPFRVHLTSGMKICQLIFEQTMGTPAKGYAGAFAGQSAV